MNQIQNHKTRGRTIVLVCLILLVQTSLVRAADDITGDWEITMEFGGQRSFATLSIAEKADGALTGKWGSSELSNVKFKDGKLTFTRTIRFGDNEYTMNYIGSLEDGKLVGLLSSDRGEFPANGARKKPKLPVLGHWDMKFNVGEREITGKLSISQKANGTLDGKWASERGNTVISNVKFQGGKLTYHRKSTFGERTYESDFEGAVRGHKLTGAFKSQRGDMPATGQRIGAAIIGKWELTTTSERGPRNRTLTVYGDLTGRYESFGGEIPIKDLKLEGNQVTFAVETRFGDRTFSSDFKGKLDGANLTGQMTSSRGTREVTGRWIQAAWSLKRKLKVYSKPPDATVFYRRHGDREYGPPHHEPTTTGILLEYACWYVKVEKEGYKPQEKFFDPYRTDTWRIDFDLQPVK
ncbi:MAG: hypothetical protein CEE38_23075 [Planctomycetes bacterium B3_Pla]|nr:MAG: hypothetical protein CEE38_23075 [Planctomycetes bacterium B3_Pla]